MKTLRLYRYSRHGIDAVGPAKQLAFMLIVRECAKRGIPAPTYEEVSFVRDLNQHEIDVVMKRGQASLRI